MSVDIVLYRVRVGSFCFLQGKMKGVRCLNSFELYSWLRLILLRAGDIETHPGPFTDFITQSSERSFNISKHFSVVHYNVQSARAKIDILSHELKMFDVICLTETWFSANTDPNEIIIPGFHPPQRYDRDQDAHGGVAVYVKDNIPYSRRADLELAGIECVWVEIHLRHKRLLIGTFYRPPNSGSSCFNQIENSIGLAVDTGISDIIITGDFNLDILQATSCRKITSLCRELSLSQLITDPTHFTESSQSVIDLIMSSNTDRIIASGVGEPFLDQNIRYHCPVFCILNFSKSIDSPFQRRIWRYKDGDYAGMRNSLSQTDWDSVFTEDIDTSTENITNHLLALCSKYIPNKIVTVRQSDPPWFHNDLRKKVRQRKRAYDKAKKTNLASHWDMYRKIRNETISLLRQSKRTFTETLAQKLRTNELTGSDWWKTLKSFIKPSSSISMPPLKHDNIYCYDDDEKANLLNSFFTSQTKLNDSNKTIPRPSPINVNQVLNDIEIIPSEVEDILANLQLGKANGPDGINSHVLKQCSSLLASPLCRLFNLSLRAGHFPAKWKEANVTPIFKKNDPSDPSNYRPISLLSILGKVMEKIVHKHVFNFLHDNSIISPLQSGFIPGDSTTNQLVDIYNSISKALDDGLEVRAVFCDISKAFDRVWHTGLLHKLRSVGIGGNLLSWFSNYLSNRKQRVVLPKASSSWSPIHAGVPQGSILGPLLFLIYINDIVNEIQSNIRLFADDTTLYVIVENPVRAAESLEGDLQTISSWAEKWLVTFNPSKTESLLFTRKANRNAHPPIHMNGQILSEVDCHKHLGLILDSKCNWHSHINMVLDKAWARINIMRKLKFVLDRKSLQTVYFSFIRPLLEYSDVVWDNCTQLEADEIEKIQHEAGRIVTGTTRLVSLEKLHNETGWEPLSYRRKTHKLVLFFQMVHNATPSYLSLLVPPQVGNLSRYNLRNERNYQTIACRSQQYFNSFLPSVIRDWNELPEDIKSSRSVKSFKVKLNRSVAVPYYFLAGNRTGQVHLCRLRTDCSPLNSNLYRKNILPSPNCSCGEIEDAHHYFFSCPNYTEQRRLLMNKISSICEPSLSNILFGDPHMSDVLSLELALSVQQYIVSTKRFAN